MLLLFAVTYSPTKFPMWKDRAIKAKISRAMARTSSPTFGVAAARKSFRFSPRKSPVLKGRKGQRAGRAGPKKSSKPSPLIGQKLSSKHPENFRLPQLPNLPKKPKARFLPVSRQGQDGRLSQEDEGRLPNRNSEESVRLNDRTNRNPTGGSIWLTN